MPGTKNKFLVRTAGAGSGILAVFVDGPSKAALSCKEVEDGYEFTFTPFCPGDYLITIKYGNIPIAGSPYKTNVSGEYRRLVAWMSWSQERHAAPSLIAVA